MSGEEKIYTAGEMEILTSNASIKTMQNSLLNSFNEHKENDDENFGQLYKADRRIMDKIDEIPDKMISCKKGIKDEILKEASEKYVTITDFKVFKTWVITGMTVGITVGSIVGSIVSFFLKINGG